MSGITVPEGFKQMMVKPRVTTEEHKPSIRRIIEQNPGKPITQAEWMSGLGTTSAVLHVKKLMKQGYITRQRRGKAFLFEWHQHPLASAQARLANGETVSHSLNLPPIPTISDLRGLVVEWFDDDRPSAEQLAGALLFRKWIESKIKGVETERKEILDGHNNSNNSSVDGLSRSTEKGEN